MAPDNTPNPGKKRVAAVIGGGLAELEREERRGRIVWPAKGQPHDGVPPGKWRQDGPLDDTGNLPEDCPVKPLGYEGENFYFIDTMGQVFSTGGKACGVERMQILFAGHEDFLCWAWPAFGKGAVTGFKAEEARRDLYAACRERGPWSPTDRVRGRGAWKDELGRLILHCGEELFIDGRLEDTGEHGDYFYVRRPKIALPWRDAIEAAEDNPAVHLVDVLRTWNFVRGDTDVLLLIGWLGVALMGAALDWRPSAFIVGDAGTGKSSLHNLLKAILNRQLIATTNATSAGLYQLIGHDALPIAIDEIEGDDAGQQSEQIIKMARDAASGSVRIRGGADHKGVEFAARSAFLFSAINPPPINKASLSRLAVLQLREFEKGKKEPVVREADLIAQKLLRRVADGWEDFPRLLEAYKQALFENGHSSRGQATFGTFLAAAHTLLGDAGMEACQLPWENLFHWGAMLRADATAEVSDGEPNWSRCIDAILSAPTDAWNKGDRSTVGQLLQDLVDNREGSSFHATSDKLATAGLGLVKFGAAFEGYGLAVPHSHRSINRLLEDTPWAGRGETGAWSWALRQAPVDIVRHKIPSVGGTHQGKETNRMRIGGVQKRCSFIGLAELFKWQEKQG